MKFKFTKVDTYTKEVVFDAKDRIEAAVFVENNFHNLGYAGDETDARALRTSVINVVKNNSTITAENLEEVK